MGPARKPASNVALKFVLVAILALGFCFWTICKIQKRNPVPKCMPLETPVWTHETQAEMESKLQTINSKDKPDVLRNWRPQTIEAKIFRSEELFRATGSKSCKARAAYLRAK